MGRCLLAISISILTAACAGGSVEADHESLTIYTSVTRDTVDAVVDGFESTSPGTTVEVFRAPTGELAARIAAELRNGALEADILWMTDPISIQQYERDGLLLEWTPDDLEAVPGAFRTAKSFGTRVLNLVIVSGHTLLDPPRDWADLAGVEGTVALPDPGFAGSAFAALGFFALDPGYGLQFYRDLESNGAVQVQSPGDVVNGVAEGIYAAGLTLDRTARDAVDDGSPVDLIWPSSGAIAFYSPIAVVDDGATSTAKDFVDYVLGAEAQTAIAATGWEPIRDDVEWSHDGDQQTIDWEQAFDRQGELLAQYREIFDG